MHSPVMYFSQTDRDHVMTHRFHKKKSVDEKALGATILQSFVQTETIVPLPLTLSPFSTSAGQLLSSLHLVEKGKRGARPWVVHHGNH